MSTQAGDDQVGAATRFDGDGALWAADEAGVLGEDPSRRGAFRDFSRRWSVASPTMAFLVLERAADYVAADIAPPDSLLKDERLAYEGLRRERDLRLADARRSRLDEVLVGWEERKRWWATRFVPVQPVKPPLPGGRTAGDAFGVQSGGSAGAANLAPPPPPPPPPMPIAMAPSPPEPNDASTRAAAPVMAARSRSEEIAVTAQRRSAGSVGDASGRATDTDTAATTRIEVAPWRADRPYLKALDGAGPRGYAAAMAVLSLEHGALPAFWFDVGQWLHAHNRDAEAAEAAESALGLPTADERTTEIVADRLQRYGEIDRAIELRERAAAIETDRPQPKRLLALALVARAGTRRDAAARADLDRALKLLTEVVLTPTDPAFAGSELVALDEANAVIARLRTMGVTRFALDPRLIALLDADVRVVIDWNTAATDIDLWVDEPSGERAIYSHQRTASGGLLSADMRQGYGPEEYVIHHAPAGPYRVRINTFAVDRLSPNGATTVSAHLIRDFGRSTERQEAIDIDLVPGAEGEKAVGVLTVGGVHGLRR